jgi:hypothetical protein
MSRYLSDNITYDNSGKYSSKIPLILCPLLADTGHSELSVPFSISKGLTGIFPYDSYTRLPSKLTSTVDKNRKVRFSVLAHNLNSLCL